MEAEKCMDCVHRNVCPPGNEKCVREHLSDVYERIIEDICDNYCKYAEKADINGYLGPCGTCPLNLF